MMFRETYIQTKCEQYFRYLTIKIGLVVIAECESVALGLVLNKYDKTSAADWNFEEINTNEYLVHEVFYDHKDY